MGIKDIIIISAAVLVALAFRIYRDYTRKKAGKGNKASDVTAGSPLQSSSADDDYEPYSKKK